MTKRNLTLGTASGRLGSEVYFRRRGQQITRVLVSSINDPRTRAQCYVRGRFANYVALWRLIRPYVEQSWRGVSRYGSTENAFYRHNRGLMPLSSKEMSRLGYAFPSFGLMTYGSLPVAYNYQWATEYVPALAGSREAAWLYNIDLSTDVGQDTVDGFSKWIIAANVGLREGDVLHFLAVTFSYYPNTFNPAGALEQPPRVIHNSIQLNTQRSTPISDVLPDIEWLVASLGDDVLRTGFTLKPSVLPSDESDSAVGFGLCSYVERPTNPQHARFTRSAMVMPSDCRFYLYPMAVGKGNVGDMYANTWQSV